MIHARIRLQLWHESVYQVLRFWLHQCFTRRSSFLYFLFSTNKIQIEKKQIYTSQIFECWTQGWSVKVTLLSASASFKNSKFRTKKRKTWQIIYFSIVTRQKKPNATFCGFPKLENANQQGFLNGFLTKASFWWSSIKYLWSFFHLCHHFSTKGIWDVDMFFSANFQCHQQDQQDGFQFSTALVETDIKEKKLVNTCGQTST